MIFLDTETCGFTGPVVLIQYAVDDGKVILYEVFKEPIAKTLRLLKWLCENDICGFNLTFDWFHLVKLYNILEAHQDHNYPPRIVECIYWTKQKTRKWCLRPKSALDLFLYLRKTKWQDLMGRKEFRLRDVPYQLANSLRDLLNKNLSFSDIYFFHRSDKSWLIEPTENKKLVDVVLKLAPSSGLKAVVHELLRIPVIYDGTIPLFKNREDEEFYGSEVSYNPYSIVWAEELTRHAEYWHSDKKARQYAQEDVIHLQRLYEHFYSPESGDVDSELAICVGAVRWHGYNLNMKEINKQYQEKFKIWNQKEINVNSPIDTKEYLIEVAEDYELAFIPNTTAKTLEALSKLRSLLGKRASYVKQLRELKKELDILRKLKSTGRFCPEFKIIGTKSGRMSGGSAEITTSESLNPQGIQHKNSFRKLFKMFDGEFTFSGGDFESFEVTIADAAYGDEKLREDLESGKKFHALLGSILYEKEYDEVLLDEELYYKAKQGAFSIIYGAQKKKIAEVAGIPEEEAEESLEEFFETYPQIASSRKEVFDAFCSMKQPAGVGTEVIWDEPAEYIESLLGFRRYFNLENRIAKILFNLARNLPKNFTGGSETIIRRTSRGQQTLRGALQSSLYALAFSIQAKNMRAAANHVIQSTGAYITKSLQKAIWDCQPVGIAEWQVIPMNMHDEVLVCHRLELMEKINEIVRNFVKENQQYVPLLAIDWKNNLSNWGELKE